jgi:hypothetical protein
MHDSSVSGAVGKGGTQEVQKRNGPAYHAYDDIHSRTAGESESLTLGLHLHHHDQRIASRIVSPAIRVSENGPPVRRLAMTRLAKQVLDLVPETKPGDALQMAVSAAHEMDYLLTWNYAHLANPIAQGRLEAICRRLNLHAPLLVSPESIPQVRFGQAIRRRKP